MPDASSTARAVVAVASSAGGIGALMELFGSLPADFAAPVLVVQHISPHHHTMVAELLGNRCSLPVKLAQHGEALAGGVIYIAPPDHHLQVDEDGMVALSMTPPVNFVRPSADLLFESVARTFGDRAIACVLTGAGHDGATGVIAIHGHGGTVIAQDPANAETKGMPQAAINTGVVDLVLPLEKIGPWLSLNARAKGVDEHERE